MKKQIVLTVALTVLFGTSVHAAEFNPNNIISDETLQDWQSMDRKDIQVFLESQDSFLARYRSPDYKGKRKKASDIIYQAAKEYKINPKFLLATLQKEQSLITIKKPSEKRLNWATGYAVCDSCKTTDAKIQKYKGFGKQVDAAAGVMRWYYDNAEAKDWIKQPGQTLRINGKTIRPENQATINFYLYTPHFHGNENFHTIWNRWFSSVYPSGTLMKTASNPDVYLIQDGKKRVFKNNSALITRFDPKQIITVTADVLSKYPTGRPISLPNFSILKLKNTDDHFLVDYDYLRPFETKDVVRKLGYHPDEIVTVSRADIRHYKKGKTISNTKYIFGKLFKTQNGLFYVKDNQKQPIASELIAKNNFPNLSIEVNTDATIASLSTGKSILLRDGTLMKVGRRIYVIENGKRRFIPSERIFKKLGYSAENVLIADDATAKAHKTGAPIELEEESRKRRTRKRPTRSRVTRTTRTTRSTRTKRTRPTKPAGPTDETGVLYKTPANKIARIGAIIESPVEAFIITDAQTGSIYAGKNIDVVRPIASLTKAMTAYRLQEEGLSHRQSTTYRANEHKSLYHRYKIAEGEVVRNSDLWNALLISSLNTPSRMLVDSVEKDESAFVTRMTEQAKSFGLAKTNFADTSGINLHNLSTAKEYATLFPKLLENKKVRDTLGRKTYKYNELKDLDDNKEHYDSHSNDLLKKDLPFKIIASKTGYLYEAGACLAMLIERPSDGKQFVVITLGNPDYKNRFVEPERLATHAINNF